MLSRDVCQGVVFGHMMLSAIRDNQSPLERSTIHMPTDDTTNYDTIEYRAATAETPIAQITLNQPNKRNPIGLLTCGELIDALKRTSVDANARVVVLTGSGPVFSAGGDLSAFSKRVSLHSCSTDSSTNQTSKTAPASLVAVLEFMHQLGIPIIAMVNGHALAGGLGLMVACDLVIACERATFGTTEVAVGLWPMMITAELVRNVGRKMALELMLTGKRIDAHEAQRIGLINRVVDTDQLWDTTEKLARTLANNSPTTMALGLRAFYQTQDMSFSSALAHLEAEFTKVLATPDAAEGVTAFLAKRPPVWPKAGG